MSQRVLNPVQFKLKHEGAGHTTFEPDVPNQYSGHDAHGSPYVSRHPVEGPVSEGRHNITASTRNGKVLGSLSWDSGVIKSVDVSDRWQHKGMATQMFRRAQEITPGLSHSNNRTEKGNDWAKAVGGPLPPRLQDNPENYR